MLTWPRPGSARPAADPAALGHLAGICIRACDQIRLQELTRSVRALHEWLRAGAQAPAASPLWDLLADALAHQDLEQWHRLREELRDLHELAPAARRLSELKSRLSAAVPDLDLPHPR